MSIVNDFINLDYTQNHLNKDLVESLMHQHLKRIPLPDLPVVWSESFPEKIESHILYYRWAYHLSIDGNKSTKIIKDFKNKFEIYFLEIYRYFWVNYFAESFVWVIQALASKNDDLVQMHLNGLAYYYVCPEKILCFPMKPLLVQHGKLHSLEEPAAHAVKMRRARLERIYAYYGMPFREDVFSKLKMPIEMVLLLEERCAIMAIKGLKEVIKDESFPKILSTEVIKFITVHYDQLIRGMDATELDFLHNILAASKLSL